MQKEKPGGWRPNYNISTNGITRMYKPKRLFGSGTRVKILKLFFQAQPGTEFYGREICRRTNSQVNAVRMELKNLEQLGVIKPRIEQRKIMYRVNDKSQKIDHLRSLILQ